MRSIGWRGSVLGLFLSMLICSASAAVSNWDYTVDAQFITTPGSTTYTTGVLGCTLVSTTAIAWGACPNGPAVLGIPGRSGIGISNTPRNGGTLTTNGPAEVANTYTHSNNIVSTAYRTLRKTLLLNNLGLRSEGSGDPFEYFPFVFTIRFVETSNDSENFPCVVSSNVPCADIWVLEGSLNQTILIGGREYIVNFFPDPAPTPMPSAVCAAAYPELPVEEVPECIGFTTAEQEAKAINLLLNVTYKPALVNVSGRVYAEQSTPVNTQDNGNAVDPGVVTQVSLTCTNPTYSAGPLSTVADGSFNFTDVPAEASCIVSTTPPAGYQAAYTQQGTTGEMGHSGVLNTSVAGSIGEQSVSVSVPLPGSAGSLFALRPLTDMSSQTVCSPNPAAANSTVSCTTTCMNTGNSTAINAFCSIPNASSLPGNPDVVCSSATDLISGGSLTCTVNFTMPVSGNVNVNGGTGADNDSNGGSSPASGNNPSTASVARPGEGQVSQPTPVPSLGAFALLLLPGLMGLGVIGQYKRRK